MGSTPPWEDCLAPHHTLLPWEVLTPLLHEAEEVIQELLPLGVSVQFIELRTEWARVSRMKGRGREALSQPHTSCRQF